MLYIPSECKKSVNFSYNVFVNLAEDGGVNICPEEFNEGGSATTVCIFSLHYG